MGESWHGTLSGYRSRKCRCDDCRRAAREYQRAYRAARPGQNAAYQRSFRKAHPDYEKGRDSRDRSRVWREVNRERKSQLDRDWRARNPGRKAEYDARRRALIGGATISAEAMRARMAYFGFRCWMCRGPFEHVDHVKPLAKGGPHILANLRPACAPCNVRKGASWR